MLKTEENNKKIQNEALHLLQELIKNKCVNHGKVESGNEIKSVKTLTKYFDSYGLSDYEIFEPYKTRGNLLLTLTGGSSSRSLTLQSHLDVVPATDNWSVDPFRGVVKDDWVYGRGTIDMLLYTATQAVTVTHLIHSGWKPNGMLKFLAVADEEAGGMCGARWLVENVPNKIKTDYLIGELGGAILETPSGTKMGIMNAEKGPGWVRMKIEGVSGHGSYPFRSKNALEMMSSIISNMKHNPPPVTITPEWINFVDGLGLNKFIRFLLTHKRTVDFAINQLAKRQLGLAKVFHALTRMTVSPNVGNAGNKVNVIPDQAFLETDIRLLSGQNKKDVLKYLDSVIPKEFENSVDTEFVYLQTGSSDKWNNEFTDIFSESYKMIHPNQDISSVFIPGVTDAQHFRKIGIKCYGACVLSNKVDVGLMTDLYHGKDERIPLEALTESVQFYSSVIQKYLK